MWKWRIPLTAAALLVTAGVTWPPLYLVAIRANLPTFYMENIGWRFFWVERFVAHVPGDYVHPGQGVLLPLIQSIFYLGAKLLGLDLFGQITIFGHLTLIVAAVALAATLVAIALDDRLDPAVRAALLTTPLVMSLSAEEFFAYDLYPDYMAYAKVLFTLFAWRWLHHRADGGGISSHAAAELGFLAGLLGALKVNYLPWAAALLLISVIAIAIRRGREVWSIIFRIGLGALVSMGGTFLIFYHGHLQEIVTFFVVLVGWASSLKGGAINFPPETTFTRLTAILGILLLLRLIPLRAQLDLDEAEIEPAVEELSRRVLGLITVVVTAALAGVLAAMNYYRGGSSYFDAVAMLSVLCVIAAADLANRRMIQVASFGVAAAFFAWPAKWTVEHWKDYATVSVSAHISLAKLATVGDWQRDLFNWNMSRGLPVYVLTPTNYDTQGTIEDMIFMGFQNFGGAPADYRGSIQALHPGLNYLYYDNIPYYRLTLPPEQLVFMRIIGEPYADFPHLDARTLALREAQVERILQGRRQEECYTVKQPITGQNILSCVLSAPN